MKTTTGARAAAAAGFTLVEVLVALFVMSLLAALAWQGIDGLSRSRDASRAQLQRVLALQTMLAQWEQDLGAAIDPDAGMTAAARAKVAPLPPVHFDGARLRIVRRTPDGAPAGLQVVSWTLRAGRWTRWTSPVAVRRADLARSWLGAQQLLGGEPGETVLAGGVTLTQVFFYRNNGWSNAQSSGDIAIGSAREKPPDAVRLEMRFDGGGALTRDVLVQVESPT